MPPCQVYKTGMLAAAQLADVVIVLDCSTGDIVYMQQGHCLQAAMKQNPSALVPAGSAMFLGNSMPIRDMDMYACSPSQQHGQGQAPQSQGSVTTPAGVRIAANRGASGIDGVLSAAAGFAVGLQRPVTLVVGDVSFVHDSNGLSLLRSGAGCAPLLHSNMAASSMIINLDTLTHVHMHGPLQSQPLECPGKDFACHQCQDLHSASYGRVLPSHAMHVTRVLSPAASTQRSSGGATAHVACEGPCMCGRPCPLERQSHEACLTFSKHQGAAAA